MEYVTYLFYILEKIVKRHVLDEVLHSLQGTTICVGMYISLQDNVYSTSTLFYILIVNYILLSTLCVKNGASSILIHLVRFYIFKKNRIRTYIMYSKYFKIS